MGDEMVEEMKRQRGAVSQEKESLQRALDPSHLFQISFLFTIS